MTDSFAEFSIESAVVGDNGFRLRWSAASKYSRYRVIVSQEGLPSTVVADRLATLSTSVTLARGNYQVVIEAFDNAGSTKRSNVLPVTVP